MIRFTVSLRSLAAFFICILAAILSLHSSQESNAAIVASGNITGSGTPYDGVSDPWNPMSITVGNSAPGSLTINGGSDVNVGTSFNATMIAGQTAASPSSITVDGVGSTFKTTQQLIIGNFGNATLNITNGGTVTNPNAGSVIAAQTGSNSVVNVGGGSNTSTWNAGGLIFGTTNSTATLNINSRGVVNTIGFVQGTFISSDSKVNFDGGKLSVTLVGISSYSPFWINFNMLANGGTIEVLNSTTPGPSRFDVEQAIAGTGPLTKTGPAILQLNRTNTYSGNTVVEAGTLQLDFDASISKSPLITVKSGAVFDVSTVVSGANYTNFQFTLVNGQVLTGNGRVSGGLGIAAGSKLAPGDNFGMLITNSLKFIAPTSVLEAEVDLAGAMAADVMGVNGTITLNNSTLNLSILNPDTSTLPRTFLLFHNDFNDPVSGTFGTINVPTGYTASVNYTFSGTDSLGRVGTGNDIAVTITAIPEPSTICVFGLSVMGLLLTARRNAAGKKGRTVDGKNSGRGRLS